MQTQLPPDLSDFHRFVGEKVPLGERSLSPEEVLDEWRELHPSPNLTAEEIAAIQEALDDLENGEQGVLWEEFDRSFRTRHNLPPRA